MGITNLDMESSGLAELRSIERAIKDFDTHFKELLGRDEVVTTDSCFRVRDLHEKLSMAWQKSLPFAPLIFDGILAVLTVIDKMMKRPISRLAKYLLKLERQSLCELLVKEIMYPSSKPEIIALQADPSQTPVPRGQVCRPASLLNRCASEDVGSKGVKPQRRLPVVKLTAQACLSRKRPRPESVTHALPPLYPAPKQRRQLAQQSVDDGSVNNCSSVRVSWAVLSESGAQRKHHTRLFRYATL